jgi:hypothetical protein
MGWSGGHDPDLDMLKYVAMFSCHFIWSLKLRTEIHGEDIYLDFVSM